MSKKTVGFVLGSIFGAAAGVVAGIMIAPRSGAESRAMAADAMNDAWDSAVDTYERAGAAVNDVTDKVVSMADAAAEQGSAPAEAVHVEVVEPEPENED